MKCSLDENTPLRNPQFELMELMSAGNMNTKDDYTEDETSDGVMGYLTAEDVFERIVTMYKADSTYDNAEHCVCCGAVIPEGRQVCPQCEGGENNV